MSIVCSELSHLCTANRHRSQIGAAAAAAAEAVLACAAIQMH
jgi:hypothetical protein